MRRMRHAAPCGEQLRDGMRNDGRVVGAGAAVIWLWVMVGVMVGVAQEAEQAPQPVRQEKSLQGVRVTLEAERQRMGMADRLRVTLSVEAPVHTAVTLPQVVPTLGPFQVLRHTPSEPIPLTPQTQQWQQDYTLEAESSGELTLPPLTVAFQDADAALRQIRTDPIVIMVTSVLPDDADVRAPKDIAPPVALVRRGMPLWLLIAVWVLLGMGLMAGLWWYQRRRGRAAPPPPRPAHVLALQALQHLQRQDLIGTPHIEEFYVRLSAILRRYVEWRFGLRAPEQTTEEFLAAMVASGGLIATHRELLGTFLQHCDLVKFARHEPASSDMQDAFDSAKDFVEQTADDQVLVAPEVAGAEI